MTNPSQSLVIGAFDVQLDTMFALDDGMVELDAYALLTDGNTITTELSLRYAQVTTAANGYEGSTFIASSDAATIATLPAHIQAAYAEVIKEATVNQAEGRILTEA